MQIIFQFNNVKGKTQKCNKHNQHTLKLPGFGVFLKEPSLCSGAWIACCGEHSRGCSFSWSTCNKFDAWNLITTTQNLRYKNSDIAKWLLLGWQQSPLACKPTSCDSVTKTHRHR